MQYRIILILYDTVDCLMLFLFYHSFYGIYPFFVYRKDLFGGKKNYFCWEKTCLKKTVLHHHSTKNFFIWLLSDEDKRCDDNSLCNVLV